MTCPKANHSLVVKKNQQQPRTKQKARPPNCQTSAPFCAWFRHEIFFNPRHPWQGWLFPKSAHLVQNGVQRVQTWLLGVPTAEEQRTWEKGSTIPRWWQGRKMGIQKPGLRHNLNSRMAFLWASGGPGKTINPIADPFSGEWEENSLTGFITHHLKTQPELK
jgi:hypothetical protein